jgi:hypothetical protein
MIPSARGANSTSVTYGRGGVESIVTKSEGLAVLNPFRPFPGQWMRVRGEMSSLVNDHDEFVKSLAPRVNVLRQEDLSKS